jgi:hypothetical protein
MKHSKSRKISRRQQRLAQLQVLEHIERYHPEMTDVTTEMVEISPCGTFASVRSAPGDKHNR